VRRVAAAVLGLLAVGVGTARAQAPPPPAATVPEVDLLGLLSQLFGKGPQAAVIRLPGDEHALTLLPAFSVNPSTGALFGVSGNLIDRYGPAATTNLSSFNAGVSYTTKGQLAVSLKSHLFLADNRLKFEGDWRYLDTKQVTYGLGGLQPESAGDSTLFNLLRLHQFVYFRTAKKILVGPGYLFDRYFDIQDLNALAGQPSPIVEYEGANLKATTSSGMAINALIDRRDSPVYATRGILASASARIYPEWLGSTNAWRALALEFRGFQSLDAATRHVLAFWAMAQFTGGKPPYHNLPAIGWDTSNRSGRGYLQGRIRGVKLLYGEAEYRVVLTRNGLLGAVAFGNVTSSADATTRELSAPSLGGGLGVRLKLNARSRSNITLDYAFSPGGFRGLFLGTSEAF
jgi:hypothetical protein